MHPGWRHANGPSNVLDDVAIVQLDAPVTTVAPVALGATPGAEAWILGRGRQFAPGTGHSEKEILSASGLRQAPLRPISDQQCAAAWKHRRGNAGERFDAARMLCAIDVDGLEPLSSGCNGDSGGPLYTGTAAAPVLLGVVSWGSTRCGADHTPSVFAEVARYRDFITDPSPTWAPAPTSAPTITGARRVGAKLTCAVAGYTARPTKVEVQWQRQGGRQAQERGPRAHLQGHEGRRRSPAGVQRHGQQRRRHLDRAVRAHLDGEDPEVAQGRRAVGRRRAGPVAGHGLRLRKLRLRGVSRATRPGAVFARPGALARVAVRRRLLPSRPQLLRRLGAPPLSAGVSRHRGRPPRWRANGCAPAARTAVPIGTSSDQILVAAEAHAPAVLRKPHRRWP